MTALHISADADWLKKASDVVLHGGVVAVAFERLFGLAADALDADAVARSAAIKDRPTHEMGTKPIAVILPSIDYVNLVSTGLGERARALANRYWPGPLTLLVPAREGIPLPLVGPGGLIGVRVPGPSLALQLARHTRKVLTATSANRRGADEPLHSQELIHLAGVDMVVAGEVAGPPGSTIVIADGGELNVIRQGIISISMGDAQ